ncbi:MAG: MFS transporter, partial [Deltaproteobacteria bacterium]|nr:MFS transporter [Deltaproteobacteria bacterium]
MINEQESNYRWFIIILSGFTAVFSITMPSICMPVLFKEISIDMDLSLVQLGTIWGMGGLAGIFTTLAGGLIGDRYGTKRTLTVACILAGIA